MARMPFGRHVGKPVAEVPEDYLLWAICTRKMRADRAAMHEACVRVLPLLRALIRDYDDTPGPVAPGVSRFMPIQAAEFANGGANS